MPECKKKSDCGIDGFIGESFCFYGDVFQVYKQFSCNNAGTLNGTCSNILSIQLKDDCGERETCSKGQCKPVACYKNSECGKNSFKGDMYCNAKEVINDYEIFECRNPGTAESKCVNYTVQKVNKTCSSSCSWGECTIGNVNCFIDSHCGINDFTGNLYCMGKNVTRDYKEFKCNNPGTNESTCTSLITPKVNNVCSNNQICSGGTCLKSNITCFKNSECGSNQFIDGFFCKQNNVTRNYQIFECLNPGTTESRCINYSVSKTNKTCSANNVCYNGECRGECKDNDKDGYDNCEIGLPGDDSKLVDCNDNDISIYPNSIEICDNKDNNCNLNIDENNGNCGNQKVCSLGECKPIACFKNLDCGVDGLATDPFCLNNEVTQLFSQFVCNNPGTISSSCSNITSILVKTKCNEYQKCFNGTCIDQISCSTNSQCGKNQYVGDYFCTDKNVMRNYQISECRNPGTVLSKCINYTVPKLNKSCSDSCSFGQCTIGKVNCFVNSHCGTNHLFGNLFCTNDQNISRNFMIYECKNPGTQNSYCTNYSTPKLNNSCNKFEGCSLGKCVPIVCRNNQECGFDGYIGGLSCRNGDVYQDYITFTCNNNGTILSFCSNVTNPKIDKCTQKQTCLNGMCVDVTCKLDSDCGEDGFIGDPFLINGEWYQKYQSFTCTDPGTIFSRCKSEIENWPV